MTGDVQLNVRVPAELAEALRSAAVAEDRSLSSFVRRALQAVVAGSLSPSRSEPPEDPPFTTPKPREKVVDLMGKLEESVAAAKEARVRHKAGPTPCKGGSWQAFPSGALCSVCRAPKDRHE